MMTSQVLAGGLRSPRLWPDRGCHAPPINKRGRTLHLLDFENLCGGPDQILIAKDWVMQTYRIKAGVSYGDHVVIGCNPMSLLDCLGVFPGCRLVGRHGPDGADLALLDVLRDLDWIARRFDRVVIGSGDHIFAQSAAALRSRGVLVGVVAPRGSLSNLLASSAGFLEVIPPRHHQKYPQPVTGVSLCA